MKKTAIAFIMTTCLGIHDLASAAYAIKLKNGNEYITNRYWQERDQVLFDTYGGVFGVDKTFVRRIELTDREAPILLKLTSENQPGSIVQNPTNPLALVPTANDQDKTETETKNTTPSELSKPKEQLKKDEAILKQFGELQNRFGNLNDLPEHEVRALKDDIESFRNKVTGSNFAEAHQEETDAMMTLQRAIDGYLKSTYP